MMEEVRKRPEDEPQLVDVGGLMWTCPEGWKHPSCDGCGHRFYELKPERSIGGASVKAGFLCGWCQRELNESGGIE